MSDVDTVAVTATIFLLFCILPFFQADLHTVQAASNMCSVCCAVVFLFCLLFLVPHNFIFALIQFGEFM